MTLAGVWERPRGDRAEFETKVRDHHRQAYGFALRLAGNSADAEDLLQEGYVRAFRFFHRYDREMPFGAWLYRILTNAHIDSLRRRKRFVTTSFDSEAGQFEAARLTDPNADADHAMNARGFDAPLENALSRLKPEFRTAVLLADVEGMAYEEIAEVMGTSVGTVRSRIHRGRKALRAYLTIHSPEMAARWGS